MYEKSVAVPCSIMRGGTSKGVFFKENDIPPKGPLRDKLILRVFGSPDIRQIDGLGGANSLTSKVAIIGPSQREEADIDYTFGQVSVTDPVIDWVGNCGNISSAVGLFAIDEGLVKISEPFTTVRIFNTNTSKVINARIPVKDLKILSEGDFQIPGVPLPGAKILLEFINPSGSVTGKLLPTGNPKDKVDLGEKGVFTVSVVDAGNPVVFLLPKEIGLTGTELPVEVEQMSEILKLIEEIRSIVAEKIGIVTDRKLATKISPAIPKIGFISECKDYKSSDGKLILEKDIDLVARLASMQKMHRAYMVTGAVCTAVASKIRGTVVEEVMGVEAIKSNVLRIGHPYGVMDAEITCDYSGKSMIIEKIGIYRTARKIMDGYAYIPKSVLEK